MKQQYYRVKFTEYNSSLTQRGFVSEGDFTVQYSPILVKAENEEEVEMIVEKAIQKDRVHVKFDVQMTNKPFINRADLRTTFGSLSFYQHVRDLVVDPSGGNILFSVKELKSKPQSARKSYRKKGEPTYSMNKKHQLEVINTHGWEDAHEYGHFD